MVRVRMSETYDLATKLNKMSIIGIHTPDTNQMEYLYGGLMKNYRYYRLVGCDVKLACASMLPADPLQVGTESGQIAPQDMFNPMLYKAVSNESFETIIAKMYNGNQVSQFGSLDENDLDVSGGFSAYYALLAEPDGWKKAMPQNGLEMRGLYPIMYQNLAPYGTQTDTYATQRRALSGEDQNGNWFTNPGSYQLDGQIRGHAVKMPRLPTYVATVTTTDTIDSPMGQTTNPHCFDAPKTYVGCVITPPAKQNIFYFRMKVTWTIEFEEVRPLTELASASFVSALTAVSYYDGTASSAKLSKEASMVDAENADLDKVMTGA